MQEEEEGTYKRLKSLKDLQRESTLNQHMIQRLRLFLEDGNSIPMHT